MGRHIETKLTMLKKTHFYQNEIIHILPICCWFWILKDGKFSEDKTPTELPIATPL